MTKILFHHIPNTVGSAIVEQVEALFGHRVCKARDDHALTPGMIEDERYIFYHGHFSQDAVRRFREACPDAFLFTFLRHPFTRVLAHYSDLKEQAKITRELDLIGALLPGDGSPGEYCVRACNAIRPLSLDAFLTSPDQAVRPIASNFQARFLTVGEGSSASRLERAVVDAMMTYDFVGVQELHAPCLRIIEAKCGLAPDSLGGLTEQDDDVIDITSSQMEAIEAANAYDLALYHAFYGFLLKAYGTYLPPSALDVASTVRLPAPGRARAAGGAERLHLPPR